MSEKSPTEHVASLPTVTGTGTPTRRANFDAGGNSRLRAIGRSAYLQALEDGWADPRRLHSEGRRARQMFDASRETFAHYLGVRAEEIHFAPSAVAAVHDVTAALLRGRKRMGNRVVMSAVERSAYINAAQHFGESSLTPVEKNGRVDTAAYKAAVSSGGVAFAVGQHANHEVGTIQPLHALSESARTAQVPFVVDAASSLTHVAPPDCEWDALIANPADWGAGQGVGVLALKARTRYRATWPEDQDSWFPGGTSLPAIFAAAVTLSEADSMRASESVQHREWTDQIRAVADRIPSTAVVGDAELRLPHVSTFSCLYVDGEAITTELDRLGFAVGSGSACTSATLAPSHVLAAMGVLTHGNVRISLDWDVTQDDVNRFCAILPEAVRKVRTMMGVDFL